MDRRPRRSHKAAMRALRLRDQPGSARPGCHRSRGPRPRRRPALVLSGATAGRPVLPFECSRRSFRRRLGLIIRIARGALALPVREAASPERQLGVVARLRPAAQAASYISKGCGALLRRPAARPRREAPFMGVDRPTCDGPFGAPRCGWARRRRVTLLVPTGAQSALAPRDAKMQRQNATGSSCFWSLGFLTILARRGR